MPLFSADDELAKARYAELAGDYDHATRRMKPIRKRVIESLRLKPGDRVLDVACGTGKSFVQLREAVGAEGEVVGIDVSADMTELAQRRIDRAGWDNVHLVTAPMRDAALRGSFDAVLFVYAHDVLQDDAALQRIFAYAAPGAAVASTGLKLFPWYMGLANVYLMAVSWKYITTFSGLRKPWRRLHEHVPNLRVVPTFFGSGYIATGHHRG